MSGCGLWRQHRSRRMKRTSRKVYKELASACVHPYHPIRSSAVLHLNYGMLFSTFIILLLSSNVFAAPADLLPRATTQCGQYQSQASGPYTLYTNGWGWSSGTGSQCLQIDSLTGTTLAYSTTWSWSGTPNQVKSYTNVETTFTKKQLSAYTSMPTAWKWSYTGTDLRVNGMLLTHSS
jgi:xyloglucan-specific endo-beta-1,4-glucanase